MGSCRYRLNIFPVSSPVVKRKHFSQLPSQKYTGYPFAHPWIMAKKFVALSILELGVLSALPKLNRKNIILWVTGSPKKAGHRLQKKEWQPERQTRNICHIFNIVATKYMVLLILLCPWYFLGIRNSVIFWWLLVYSYFQVLTLP